MEELIFGRRYRVIEKIGTGGMADVYKAVDETLGRTVAVKVMHARYASDPAFAARFRQEAQAAANLVSPNIVNMYDWGADGDTYYIVMEYVRGTDLKSVILDKGALPSKKVADIGSQVAAALSVAHGYDIVHRDIKPHNIMVQPDGSAKVMDFGIARAGNSTMTQTGSVLGTAHYVSPEQAQGKPLTGASDLYSLGVVLYECVTGTLPFDADTPVAVALKQVNEQPLPPSARNSSIDPGLEAIIVKAMQKRAPDRYSSPDEMRRDLIRVMQGQPVHAAGAAAGAMVAGGAVAAAAARMDETAVMPSVSGGPVTQDPMQQRRPPAEKRPVWPWILAAVLLVAAGVGVAWGLGVFGPRSAPVPDVTGKTRTEAQIILTSAGFVVGTVAEDFSDSVPAGSVMSQQPAANSSAKTESTVSLTLSKGPNLAKVPGVIGKPEAEAFKILEAAGFSPQSLPSEYNKQIAAGIVFKQTPDGDTNAPKGSVVSYIVSRGAELVQVPDVTGKSQSSATSALQKIGFKVASKESSSDNTDKGSVISQSPPGRGESVAKGSTVTITVSSGPATAPVPDVFDKPEADARRAVTDAGFKVTTVYTGASPGTGLVRIQNPEAGIQVKLGSTVTITVDGSKVP